MQQAPLHLMSNIRYDDGWCPLGTTQGNDGKLQSSMAAWCVHTIGLHSIMRALADCEGFPVLGFCDIRTAYR